MKTDILNLLEDGSTMTTMSATKLSTSWMDREDAFEIGSANGALHALVTVTVAAVGSAGDTVEFQIIAIPQTTLAALATDQTVNTPVFASNWFTTVAAHGHDTGTPVVFTGADLPNGINANQVYFIISVDANTFQVATTFANALAGTAVTFSDNGTGTQTMTVQPIVLGTSGAIPVPYLQIGTQLMVPLTNPPQLAGGGAAPTPFNLPSYDYLFAKYVEGGTVTAGKWRVEFITGVQMQAYHASGFSLV